MNATLSRSSALEYATRYWDSYNPNFKKYDQADCTNYVSQCWNYGGIPVTEEWKPTFVGAKKAWVNVDGFAEYMTNTSKNYTDDNQPIATIKWSSEGIKVGDIIQFYKEDVGWYHSAMVSGIDPKYGITYTAHTKNYLRKPLSDVYPHEIKLIRFIVPNKAVD